MNSVFTPSCAGLVAALFLLQSSSLVLAQGPLTPPGAPAPAMKTLEQIELRTPITSLIENMNITADPFANLSY